MHDLAIDWLTLISQTTPLNYTLTGIDGFDAPNYRVGSYDNPGQDGATVGSQFYSSRTITLNGVTTGQDDATYGQARRNLAYVCRVRRDSNGYPTPVTITFTTYEGVSYFLTGYVVSFQHATQHRTLGAFQITIEVSDPMIYGSGQLTTGIINTPSGGGAVFPLVFPIIFAAGTGGSGSLYNAGNADTWPIITLTGAMTNPYLYCIERGKGIKLNYVSGVNDVIVINMQNKTIVLNGNSSLIGAKDITSDWFSLVGSSTNTFTLSTGSTSDTGSAVITAYPAYMGI